jgi:hypothetical protein
METSRKGERGTELRTAYVSMKRGNERRYGRSAYLHRE